MTTHAERERIERERTIDLERYQEDGCNSRIEYLETIADNFDLELRQVIFAADQLGPDEDFDGLVVFVEDHADQLAEC